MKFGINTFLWTSNFGADHFHLLPSIKEHGFHGVEVSLIRPQAFDASGIRRALNENALECTVCGVLPPELNLVADDASLRARTFEHLATCIKLTAEAGARYIAGPLYTPVGWLPGRRRTREEWMRAIDAYQRLGPVLDAHDVEVGLEPLNRFETFFLNTTADAVALCSEINHPRVGVLWDTFHANIEEKNPPQALAITGEHLKHVHTCENDRGTPGSGHVDWKGVFGALNKLGYNGWLTIESFGFALGDLSAAAAIWRDLASTPEEIAWKGIEFLRTNVHA
jgi:D-psicose/D-tagatose/L-ribulose 3-epimerase